MPPLLAVRSVETVSLVRYLGKLTHAFFNVPALFTWSIADNSEPRGGWPTSMQHGTEDLWAGLCRRWGGVIVVLWFPAQSDSTD